MRAPLILLYLLASASPMAAVPAEIALPQAEGPAEIEEKLAGTSAALQRIDGELEALGQREQEEIRRLAPLKEEAERLWRELMPLRRSKDLAAAALERKFSDAKARFETERAQLLALWQRQEELNTERTAIDETLTHLRRRQTEAAIARHRVQEQRQAERQAAERKEELERIRRMALQSAQERRHPTAGTSDPSTELERASISISSGTSSIPAATPLPPSASGPFPVVPAATGAVAGGVLTFAAVCGAGALLSPFTGGVSAAVACGAGALPGIAGGAVAGAVIGGEMARPSSPAPYGYPAALP